MFNRKTAFAATLLALGTVCAGTAHATDVHWSVGINLPQVGTVISNAPVYRAPVPVYVQPAPVYWEPAPVYVEQEPVVVYRQAPPPVVYRPAPVYAPGYYYDYGPNVVRTNWVGPRHDGWHDARWHHDRHDRDSRHDDRRDDRWDHDHDERHDGERSGPVPRDNRRH